MEGQSYYYNNKTKNICLINKDLLKKLFNKSPNKNLVKLLSKSYEEMVKDKLCPFEKINNNYYKLKIIEDKYVIIALDKSLEETLAFLKLEDENYKENYKEVDKFNKYIKFDSKWFKRAVNRIKNDKEDGYFKKYFIVDEKNNHIIYKTDCYFNDETHELLDIWDLPIDKDSDEPNTIIKYDQVPSDIKLAIIVDKNGYFDIQATYARTIYLIQGERIFKRYYIEFPEYTDCKFKNYSMETISIYSNSIEETIDNFNLPKIKEDDLFDSIYIIDEILQKLINENYLIEEQQETGFTLNYSIE